MSCELLDAGIFAALGYHKNTGSTSESISTLLPLGKHKRNSVILLLLDLRKVLASEKHLYSTDVLPDIFHCNFTNIKMIISTLYNQYLNITFEMLSVRFSFN